MTDGPLETGAAARSLDRRRRDRDRSVALAWGYVLWLAKDMDMGGMDMTGFRMIPAGIGLALPASEPLASDRVRVCVADVGGDDGWNDGPSAAPMILMYARVGRQGKAQGKPFAATGWFAAGYLLAWGGFSLAATLLQWAIERAVLLDSWMTIASNLLSAIVLIAAGVYQWTPLKDVLSRPMPVAISVPDAPRRLSRRPARLPAAGARHGGYCVGCCWVLMALLFVGGVMNVLWIALLALLVLLEKLTPIGRWIARAAGIACAAAGVWLLVSLPR